MTDLLSHGYGVRFKAPGRSMYPTIREGEIITVQPIEPCNVKPGDILLYQADERVIAHRLVRIERNGNDARFHHPSLCTLHSALSSDYSVLSPQSSSLSFLLRGDASGALDEPVEAHQILGKVVSVDRGGRNLGLYCRRVQMYRKFHIYASYFKKCVIRNPL